MSNKAHFVYGVFLGVVISFLILNSGYASKLKENGDERYQEGWTAGEEYGEQCAEEKFLSLSSESYIAGYEDGLEDGYKITAVIDCTDDDKNVAAKLEERRQEYFRLINSGTPSDEALAYVNERYGTRQEIESGVTLQTEPDESSTGGAGITHEQLMAEVNELVRNGVGPVRARQIVGEKYGVGYVRDESTTPDEGAVLTRYEQWLANHPANNANDSEGSSGLQLSRYERWLLAYHRDYEEAKTLQENNPAAAAFVLGYDAGYEDGSGEGNSKEAYSDGYKNGYREGYRDGCNSDENSGK